MAEPVAVLDVAAYILDKTGPLTTWKLQKLCYYSQAWSLVWDEKPLFRERLEAWANGPVVPALYERHKGVLRIATMRRGNPEKLTTDQRETIDAVLEAYGNKTSQWLSDLTHQEAPWRRARKRAGLSEGERGNAQIRAADMAEYYESI